MSILAAITFVSWVGGQEKDAAIDTQSLHGAMSGRRLVLSLTSHDAREQSPACDSLPLRMARPPPPRHSRADTDAQMTPRASDEWRRRVLGRAGCIGCLV